MTDLAKRERVGGTPGAGCQAVCRSYLSSATVGVVPGYSAKVAWMCPR